MPLAESTASVRRSSAMVLTAPTAPRSERLASDAPKSVVATVTDAPAASSKTVPLQADRPLSIFITDDHAVVREGLRNLMNGQSGLQVVGEAMDGEEAIRMVSELAQQGTPPDIVVMDVSMPGVGGAEATEQICRASPHTKILALTMHEDRGYLRSLLDAGASGYVLKRSAATELIRAIRTVAGGELYLDPALAATVVQSLSEGSRGRRAGGDTIVLSLSDREESVLRLIAQGYTNKEIAARLRLSVKTVETYKARSMEKLGLDSRVELVRYAMTRGWLQ